ncbi:MAG: tRNA (adenosine(37)-N6)-dimethylallyltransferase MiaA [Candidatus Doudnabacteria bacterium RIFCSPHIGHO2_01_52_17]|uniref:tRNA dimethylallyltransferase n=1 Tax=Candidatus Doudnabacteria bacterium RIFCSPHIGHO2_01_52_17 TaxID=1817820 RepID=A0A1F5NAG8_9BACT|nr:MAG: tRNA (adenosine(37)-N6)-dimethylallyltransferase MiaA [Candidatus Doudnabacteria bacterium RIFCSPHIGHO2_01_52_17]
MLRKPKIVCIVGPTASGKTELGISLAKKFRGEIVSADSRQVYRGMDVGTAKPTKRQLRTVKHFLIDIKNPNQPYTAGQYKKDATAAIEEVLARQKIPFLVGGTGLYVSAVVNNLNFPAIKPNRNLRKKLERQLRVHGLNYLFGKLTALDPEAAYIVDPNNSRRVIRALEVTLMTKKPFTKQRTRGEKQYDALILGIKISGPRLHQRIATRTKLMMNDGLVNETKQLVKKYGYRRVPFDAIGYREVTNHLKGRITRTQAEQEINKNTRRFAKRQMTWFRKMPVAWIKDDREAEKEIKKFLK